MSVIMTGVRSSDFLSVGRAVMEEALGIQRREEAFPWRELLSPAPPEGARRNEEEQRILRMCFVCLILAWDETNKQKSLF